MEVDDITTESAASTRDAIPNSNFVVRLNSSMPSNRNNSISDEAMFPELSPASSLSSFNSSYTKNYLDRLNNQRRNIDLTTLPGPSGISSLTGPSCASNLSLPSTSYANNESVDSTENTDHQIRRLFRECESLNLLNDNPHFGNDEPQSSNTGGNALSDADTIILSELSDTETEDNNNDMSENQRDCDATSPRNYDPPSAEQSDSADHLFAPEESSSSSSENSQSGVPNPFLAQPPNSSYFKFLTRGQGSEDPRSILRSSPRYRRFLRPSLPLHLSTESDPMDRDTQLRLAPNQRISSYLLHRSRVLNSKYRLRYSHTDLLSRHKTTAALNAVTSNDEGTSLAHGSDLRELNTRPYRRNLCLPKFNNEPRFNSYGTSPECDTNRYRLARDRFLSSRSPAILRSILDFEHSLRALTRPSTRARSVSPTAANPTFSASVHNDSLDDIGINLRTDNSRSTGICRFLNGTSEDQLPRPSTPPPPTLSDDESAITSLTPNNFENGILASQTSSELRANVCRQSTNVSQPLDLSEKHIKEAPRTYEELNNELIQLLECPICFEYTTPPINQCLQGHIICNNCRQRVTTCPTCRTIFQESRNLIMEKVAALLRYPCKNAVTGCLEFLYLLQKEQHEMSCGFRQYACFIPLCNWRGYKPELLVHVQETHENHVVHGPSVNLLIPVTGQTKKVWLMSAFNELFYVIFFTTAGILKGCVRFIGDASKCDSYAYNISVTSEEDMLRNFNYTRTTHAYEETFENKDMIESYDLFSISHAQLNLFRKGTKAPIRVTIEETQKRAAPTSANA